MNNTIKQFLFYFQHARNKHLHQFYVLVFIVFVLYRFEFVCILLKWASWKVLLYFLKLKCTFFVLNYVTTRTEKWMLRSENASHINNMREHRNGSTQKKTHMKTYTTKRTKKRTMKRRNDEFLGYRERSGAFRFSGLKDLKKIQNGKTLHGTSFHGNRTGIRFSSLKNRHCEFCVHCKISGFFSRHTYSHYVSKHRIFRLFYSRRGVIVHEKYQRHLLKQPR